MADADAPLTSLCTICHINPLKYTCPRCGIHTCSLPCVKLHKTRAQCSGIRNPAEYRKRSELASESSIDKDFNFITSVERNLQQADEGVKDKKIDLRPHNPPNFKGGVGLEQAAEARGVKLIRAPNGLSRRKENKSRVLGKGGNISWTVEWIGSSDQRRVQNFDETKIIGEAYFICYGKKHFGKKRKREQTEPESTGRGSVTKQTGQQGGSELAEQPRHEPRRKTSHLEQAKELAEQQEQLIRSLEVPGAMVEAEEERVAQVLPRNGTAGSEHEERPPSRDKQPLIPEHIHFYLHRPQTASKIKCLIPMSATGTIKDALRGKKIVEFPTIYIRDEAPEELSEPFILESTYLEQHGEDVMVPTQLMPPPDTVPPPAVDVPSMDSIDSQKVLEVLNQDLVSV